MRTYEYRKMISDFIEKKKFYDYIKELEARIEKLENLMLEKDVYEEMLSTRNLIE